MFSRRALTTVSRRLYSTGNNNAGIASFLERMDALYGNKKPLRTEGTEVMKDMAQKKSASAERAQKDRARKQRKPVVAAGDKRPRVAKPKTASEEAKPSPSAVKPRPRKARDDSLLSESASYVDKLDMHITPSKTFKPTERTASLGAKKPGFAPRGRPGAGRPQILRSRGAQAKGKPTASKQKPGKKRVPRERFTKIEDNGMLPTDVVVSHLARLAKAGGSSSGFASVESLSPETLISTYNVTAVSATGRTWAAVQSLKKTRGPVSEAVEQVAKGHAQDVAVAKDSSVGLQSLSNNVNAQSTMSPEFKATLVELASGNAPVSSLNN
ncbi:hypothetical protein TRVA0_003S03994 [Trichomonascus vanleenenianus]|uniref:uncharacterized protein n=1 Tax=Trichomonascus vanleenenianus TaxID=2268995 RepID=UPI003ECB62C2